MSIRGFVKGVFGLNKPPALQLGPLVNAIKDPATKEAVNYLGTVIQALIARLNQYEPAIKQALIITDALGEPVLRMGAAPPSPYTFWARSAAIGGTDPSGATSPFTSDESGVITLSGAALNIRQIDLISDPGLTDNDPGAGEISWDAFDLRFAGNTYSISAGDTANKFAYWSEGDTTLTGTDAFVPQLGDFLIFTNEAGTADEAYNKIANRAVVRENLLSGVLSGFAIQPRTAVNFNLFTTAFGVDLPVLSVSDSGALLDVVFKITAWAGGATPHLKIAIDGATPLDMEIQNGATFTDEMLGGLTAAVGDGSVVGDYRVIAFNIAFTTSLVITFNLPIQFFGCSIDISVRHALEI